MNLLGSRSSVAFISVAETPVFVVVLPTRGIIIGEKKNSFYFG